MLHPERYTLNVVSSQQIVLTWLLTVVINRNS